MQVKPSRHHAARVAAAAAVAVMALAAWAPAQAATGPGWRKVQTRQHSGPAANFNAYEAVVAPGSKDAWAFGGTNLATSGYPLAEHWTGSSWQAVGLPSAVKGDVLAASAQSSTDVWAVTEAGGPCAGTGGDVVHWNGSSWTVAKTFATGQLTGVTALSPADVWVFGSSGCNAGTGTWHYASGSWTAVTANANALVTASAISASDIWAIGGKSQAQDSIEHYNGRTWSFVSLKPLTGIAIFHGILAEADNNVWATGVGAPATGARPRSPPAPRSLG